MAPLAQTSRGRAALAAGAVVVAVLGALAGLAAADLTGGRRGREAASPTTGPVGTPVSSTTAPAATEPPSTPSSTAATTTEPSTTTTEPTTVPTTASTTTTTAPTTTATTSTTRPSTTVTTAPRPASIQIAYSQDSAGKLLVPAGGSAPIILTNTGGEPGQWLLRLTASGYQLDLTSGTLAPGESITVTVTDTRGPGHTGSINAIVAPGNQFTIPLRTP